VKVSQREFDNIVRQAIGRIPSEFRSHLDNLLITVHQRPLPELLERAGLPPDESLLGLYQGTPLRDRSEMAPPLYPDTIILFQEPIQEICHSIEEMKREIETTLVHEVAHFLGFTDEQLAELGYG
jgi:predicted Zn-dependent protease with MMP-like domain